MKLPDGHEDAGRNDEECHRFYDLPVFIGVFATVQGCVADTRTPFETYLDCNEVMKTAATEEEAVACYSAELAQQTLGERFGDLEPWLERRAAERMEQPRSFRTVVLEDGFPQDRQIRPEEGEKVQLLMYEPRGSAFRRYVVEMTLASGSWKISAEQSIGVGAIDPGGAPSSVSLDYSGGTEWASGDDVYFSGSAGPPCRLQVIHVFETYASVTIPLDCATQLETGTYRLDEINRSAGRVWVVAPELGGVDLVHAGTLEITQLRDNRLTGTFQLQASHKDTMSNEIVDYEVRGSFDNVPFGSNEE